jgi:hypothetical protein
MSDLNVISRTQRIVVDMASSTIAIVNAGPIGPGGPTGPPSDGNKGDITVSGSGGTWNINADAVGNAELANDAVNTAEIANDAVTNAKLANMAQALVKGRALGAGTGDPTDLTQTQLTALINVATTSLTGAVELATAAEMQTGTDTARVPSVSALTTAPAASTLGSELLTNPGFTGSATGWTLGGGATYGSNNVNLVAGATIEQSIAVISGELYHISWVDTNALTGVTVELGAVSSGDVGASATNVSLRAATTGTVVLRITYTLPTAASVLDSVSATLVAPNAQVTIAGIEHRRPVTTSLGVGFQALRSLTTGTLNTAVGYQALSSVTTGIANVAIGAQAQAALSSGTHNVGIGYLSQNALTVGAGNVGIGYNTQAVLKTGSFNIAIGYAAQALMTTGSFNTAVGALAQDALTSGSFNTAVGFNAQGALTTGNFNIAMGYGAQATLTSAVQCLAIGVNAQLVLTTGNNNVGIGHGAQSALTTGVGNVVVGGSTQTALTTGSQNTGVGYAAQQVLTGSNNTAMGYAAQGLMTSGAANTAIGYSAQNTPNGNAAFATTTATGQTCIGYQSGQGSASQDNEITTVGYNATAIGLGAMALGAGAAASHAGAIALGRASTTTTVDQLNVGTRDIEIMGNATKGLIMKAPNGTRYRVTIANGGTLVVTAAP